MRKSHEKMQNFVSLSLKLRAFLLRVAANYRNSWKFDLQVLQDMTKKIAKKAWVETESKVRGLKCEMALVQRDDLLFMFYKTKLNLYSRYLLFLGVPTSELLLFWSI